MRATLIEFISAFSALLPAIIFLFRFPKTPDEKLLWVVFFYLLLSFFSDVLTIWNITPGNFTTLQNTIFTIFEFLMFITYLSLSLKNKFIVKLSSVVAFCYTVFASFYILLNKKKHEDYYTLVTTIENVIIITLCVIVLYNFIKTPQILFIYSYSQFWIVIGILFYLAGTFFLSLVLKELPNQEQEKYWILNLFSNILKNIFFTIAFLMKKNTLTNQSSIKSQYYI